MHSHAIPKSTLIWQPVSYMRARPGGHCQSSVGSNHELRADPLVEVVGRNYPQGHSGLLEGGALLVRLLGRRRRLVIPNLVIESGDEHEGLVEQLSDAGLVGPDAHNAVIGKRVGGICDQPDGLEKGGDEHGLENIELKVSHGSCHADARVVAHHLGGHHGEGLALGGVDLAGHDAAAGLVLRQQQLPQPAPRPAAEEADVIGDFHEGHGGAVEGPAGLHHRVVRRQRLELVARRHKCEPSVIGNRLCKGLREAFLRVEAGADGCSTLGQCQKARQCRLDAVNTEAHLGGVATELMAQSERSGIHGVSAPNLDDVLELLCLPVQCLLQMLKARQQTAVDFLHGSNVHHSGEGVVGALALIHMVIWVHHGLVAKLAAQDLHGAVGNDLIGIHVALGAAAGLPDDQGEVVQQLSIGHLRRCLDNGFADLGIKVTGLHIHLRRSPLLDTKSPHDRLRHDLTSSANLEVLQRSLSLCPPVPVSGYLKGPKRVLLSARGGCREASQTCQPCRANPKRRCRRIVECQTQQSARPSPSHGLQLPVTDILQELEQLCAFVDCAYC
mmetsp:Transcript_14097/g.42519  ORF Transcript_14097/g.42519 Transcript_14097/m.42519 type:complete len:557 (-) Transcript_14097:154-1824(-)